MDREVHVFHQVLRGSLERLIACLEGLDRELLNWRPPAPETNSLYVLATHTLANAEENVLGIACGQPVERDRDAEFLALGDTPEPLIRRARELLNRIEAGMGRLSTADLGAEREHARRGRISVLEALLITARHAAEHVGQMELTRDLAKAAALR